MSLMPELTPDDEERIIKRITDAVMKRGLETVAIVTLETIKPVSYVGSQLSMAFVAPFLAIFGDLGIDYIAFFNKRENVERLLKRIEEEIKIIDEEKQTAKEQGKLISTRFNFKMDFPPGFSMQEETTHKLANFALIGVTGKNEEGYLAISYTEASEPSEIANEISVTLGREDVRQALKLSRDIALEKSPDWPSLRKIKGHKLVMAPHEWSDKQGQRGILESYGMWCNKTKRLFILTLRSAPLVGERGEKSQLKDLRLMIGSLRCH